MFIFACSFICIYNFVSQAEEEKNVEDIGE